MKFYVEGDKSRAICSYCEGLVETTFARRDVPFSDGQGLAKGILVAVCDQCGAVVGTPAQSTPAIKAAREAAVVPIEARLPASYFDRLDQVMHVITSAAATKHRKMFLSLYIDYLARRERSGKGGVFTLRESERCAVSEERLSYWPALYIFKASPDVKAKEESKRLSLKLNAHIADELATLQLHTQLSQTDLLKSVICQMQEEVVFRPNEDLIKELTVLARVAV